MNDIDSLLDIMARLRDPEDGCPWDLEQDFASISPYTIEEASVAPTAPTVMLADDGAMILPSVGEPDPTATDRDAFMAGIRAGHGRRGAAIGGVGDEPALFTQDMLTFHRGWSGA